uniref:Uncharacterized protein n=1 Tax=Lotharella oceanica TaxID=641309 RepID=A0A7S2TED8_9EUKA
MMQSASYKNIALRIYGYTHHEIELLRYSILIRSNRPKKDAYACSMHVRSPIEDDDDAGQGGSLASCAGAPTARNSRGNPHHSPVMSIRACPSHRSSSSPSSSSLSSSSSSSRTHTGTCTQLHVPPSSRSVA